MMWNIRLARYFGFLEKTAVLPPWNAIYWPETPPKTHPEYDESTSYDIQVTFSMIFQACSSLKMMWNINNCMLLWIFSKNGLKSACLHLWSINSSEKFFRSIFWEKKQQFCDQYNIIEWKKMKLLLLNTLLKKCLL